MTRNRLLLFLVLLALAFYSSTGVRATVPTTVKVDSIDGSGTNVTALHSLLSTDINSSAIYLASYHCINGAQPCQPDGGEGLLVLGLPPTGSSSCTSANEDQGSVFYDASNECWYRKNLNGDLRQWGVTYGSSYDANLHGTSANDAHKIIATAYQVLSNIGITEINTHQVSIYIGNPDLAPSSFRLDIPITSSFSCGATGGQEITGGIFTGRPGTIYLRHSSYIRLQSGQDSSVLHNCLILPSWLLTPGQANSDCSILNDAGGGATSPGLSFTYPPLHFSDLEAISANMIVCGDFAVMFDSNSGGTSHDLWAFGFDNPFYLSQADHSNLDYTAADGNVCYFSTAGGGNTRITNSICDVMLTKAPQIPGKTTNNCAQVDSSGKNLCNSEYWQIADIQPATSTNSYGRPNCQVKLVPGQAYGSSHWQSGGTYIPPPVSEITVIPSTSFLRMAPPFNNPGAKGDPVSYPMWISNLTKATGLLSCMGHGPFAVNVVDPGDGTYVKLDLLESDYGTGGTGGANKISAQVTWDACLQQPCAVRIVSGDVNAMEKDEVVTSTSSDFPVSASIVSVIRNAKGIYPAGGYIAEIMIDQALPAAHTGAAEQITIDSDPNGHGYMPSTGSGNFCDDASKGQCAFWHTGERAFSGYSDAGNTSSTLPESTTHHYAAGYLDVDTAGLDLTNAFSYGHHYGFVVQDANSTIMTNRGGDTNGELDDLGEEFHIVNGTSNDPSVQGGKGAQSGVGFVNNFYQTSDEGHSTTLATSLGTGANQTVNVYDTTVFSTDLGTLGPLHGRGVAGICVPTHCTSEEYVTYEITATSSGSTPGTLLITSRGDYFTAPPSASGAPVIWPATSQIQSTDILIPNFCASVTSSVMPVTNPGQNSFENVGGCLELANIIELEAKSVFVGANATATDLSSTNFSQNQFIYENAKAFATLTGCGNNLTPNQTWNCGQALPVTTSTATVMIDTHKSAIWPCDATAGSVEMIVPPGTSAPNQTLQVKKVDATPFTCTVVMSGGDTLDGQGLFLLTAVNQSIMFYNSNSSSSPLSGPSSWYSLANAAPLAHGQIYLSYNTSNTSLQLCPYNGSGVIINNRLISIPYQCLFLKNTSTTSGANVLDYIYVGNDTESVSAVASDTGGVIKVTLAANSPYKAADQVLATCSGIVGVAVANITGLAKMKSAKVFDFLGSTFSGTYLSGGSCTLLGLTAQLNTTGSHSTATNGVETLTSDPTKTLVGMIFMDTSQTIVDLPQQRDVASWFNRRTKSCVQTGIATTSTSSTVFVELDSTKECEFVTWGENEASWTAGARASNGSGSDGAAVSAGFDGATAAAEQASMMNSAAGTSGVKHSLTISGSASIGEGKHFITLVGAAVSAGSATFDSGSSVIEVKLLQ